MIRAVVVVLMLALAGPAGMARPLRSADTQAVAGRFDYYVLALSWSPVYCGRHPEDRQQCGSQRYGFVLHGLWPQYANGGSPSTCAAAVPLTEQARGLGMAVFPSEKLVAYQWRKHGSCTGMPAPDYFRLADQARHSIKLPPQFEPGSRTRETTAQAVAKAIRDSNPAMTHKSLAVVCAGPELAEVRVCLSKDLRPTACGRGVRDACRKGTIRVPGVR